MDPNWTPSPGQRTVEENCKRAMLHIGAKAIYICEKANEERSRCQKRRFTFPFSQLSLVWWRGSLLVFYLSSHSKSRAIFPHKSRIWSQCAIISEDSACWSYDNTAGKNEGHQKNISVRPFIMRRDIEKSSCNYQETMIITFSMDLEKKLINYKSASNA